MTPERLEEIRRNCEHAKQSHAAAKLDRPRVLDEMTELLAEVDRLTREVAERTEAARDCFKFCPFILEAQKIVERWPWIKRELLDQAAELYPRHAAENVVQAMIKQLRRERDELKKELEKCQKATSTTASGST